MSTLAAPTIDFAAAEPGHRARTLFFWALVTVGFAFFCTEHHLQTSKLEAYGTTAEELETSASGDHLTNQIGFSIIALLGLALLWAPGKLQFKGIDWFGLLIAATLAWCVATRLWTINPWLTTKRLGILTFCLIGALGAAKQLSARQLCLLTFVLATGYAVIGFGTELALGTFQPWSADYRFAGTMHPNGEGDNCACICLAAVPLLMTAKRGKAIIWAILLVAVSLLLLTKSRTACISMLGALGIFFFVRTSLRFKLVSALAAGTALCAALLIGDLLGTGRQMTSAALLGRDEDVGTLTGRTELWEELLTYAKARPWLGYGYGSFWTPEHIRDVSSTVYWGTESAHSVYLETTLGVGLIGLGLSMLVALGGIGRAGRLFYSTGDVGYGFIMAIMAYGLINGVSESGFASPSFTPWVVGAGLVQLAFFVPAESEVKHAIA